MKTRLCRFLTRFFLFLNVQFQIQIFRVIYPLCNFQTTWKEIIIQPYFHLKYSPGYTADLNQVEEKCLLGDKSRQIQHLNLVAFGNSEDLRFDDNLKGNQVFLLGLASPELNAVAHMFTIRERYRISYETAKSKYERHICCLTKISCTLAFHLCPLLFNNNHRRKELSQKIDKSSQQRIWRQL